MQIRQEETKDFNAVFELVKSAFENEEFSDHKEQFLVERLRKSESFVPELSLVAEIEDQIVGYILLTKIEIVNTDFRKTSLALAPVAVLKNFRGRGIGGELIEKAHAKARELGFDSIVLLGHETYYPKFGYEKTVKYGIKLPFDVPEANCMLIELKENALKGISGIVEYPKEFYE